MTRLCSKVYYSLTTYLASEDPIAETSVAPDVSSKLLFKGLDACGSDPEREALFADPKLPKLRLKHSGVWSCR